METLFYPALTKKKMLSHPPTPCPTTTKVIKKHLGPKQGVHVRKADQLIHAAERRPDTPMMISLFWASEAGQARK